MRCQHRPLPLDLSLLSSLEPTQGEDLDFNDTRGTSLSLSLFDSFIRRNFLAPGTGRVSRNNERCREPEVGFPFCVLSCGFLCNVCSRNAASHGVDAGAYSHDLPTTTRPWAIPRHVCLCVWHDYCSSRWGICTRDYVMMYRLCHILFVLLVSCGFIVSMYSISRSSPLGIPLIHRILTSFLCFNKISSVCKGVRFPQCLTSHPSGSATRRLAFSSSPLTWSLVFNIHVPSLVFSIVSAQNFPLVATFPHTCTSLHVPIDRSEVRTNYSVPPFLG